MFHTKVYLDFCGQLSGGHRNFTQRTCSQDKSVCPLFLDTLWYLTVVRHSQNGDLSDGAVSSFHSPRPLVDRGQVGVHVTGEPTSPGNLLTGSGHLSWNKNEKMNLNNFKSIVILLCVTITVFSGWYNITRLLIRRHRIPSEWAAFTRVAHGYKKVRQRISWFKFFKKQTIAAPSKNKKKW